MAIDFIRRLDQETKQKLRGFYATLSEKDQRRFAAIEATQLGHGGIKYVAQLLRCSTRTIALSAHLLVNNFRFLRV